MRRTSASSISESSSVISSESKMLREHSSAGLAIASALTDVRDQARGRGIWISARSPRIDARSSSRDGIGRDGTCHASCPTAGGRGEAPGVADRHDQPHLLRERPRTRPAGSPGGTVAPADQRLGSRNDRSSRARSTMQAGTSRKNCSWSISAAEIGLELKPLHRLELHPGLRQLAPVLAATLGIACRRTGANTRTTRPNRDMRMRSAVLTDRQARLLQRCGRSCPRPDDRQRVPRTRPEPTSNLVRIRSNPRPGCRLPHKRRDSAR